MNKSLRYIAILAVLPLFTAGFTTDYFTDAEALQSKKSSSPKYKSNADICGLQFCIDIPGGRDAWMAQGIPVDEANEEKEVMMHDDKMMHDGDKMRDGKMHDGKMMHDDDKMHDDKMMRDGDKMHDGKMMHDKTNAEPELRLSRANVPATIPLHQGYYDGGDVYFIITDSSDPTHAEIITESQGWKVELAPLLKNAPEDALSKTYMFVNGIEGDGVHGYQGEVFTNTPAQAETYSALTSHVHVAWIEEATPRVLTSDAMIMDAVTNNEIVLSDVAVVLNMPHIVWPDGQMTVKEDKTVTDELPYGGGQILDIDTDEMTVTFIAHRGWGPDGRTIYYIVTDATPSGPAQAMGVTSTPTAAKLLANSAAVDLYQFKNGLVGSGPLGFQPGIAAGAPGDVNYSPMWRIFLTEWKNPDQARLLETVGDLNEYREAGLIDISIARPMDSDHIVNCPFIDPFQ